MRQFLHAVATDRLKGGWINILKVLLLCLSYLYSEGVRCILWFHKIGVLKRQRLSKPVISIGNITLGGVGKTPLVAFIAQILLDKGVRPVILTRGYMAGKQGSDEAALFQRNLKDVPVLVGPDRISNAKNFLKSHAADVFLLDDGFQHWRLARDLDVVAIDATNPFGNQQALPRGILREPLDSLRRADMFILTKIDLPGAKAEEIIKHLQEINPQAPIIETIHKPVHLVNLGTHKTEDLDLIRGKRISSFCSIGTPESFEKTLMGLGADLQRNFAFIDHHVCNKEDLQKIVTHCQEHKIEIVITTEKDAVKLKDFYQLFKDIQIFYLRIEIRVIRGSNEFLERIHHIS